MVSLIRVLFFSALFSVSISGFSQKKKQKAMIPATQEDSLKVESVLIEAEKQLILENYAKSLESFHVALDMNSQSAVIHFKIAEVLWRSNEGQKALPYGLKAIELDPQNKHYRLGLARIYKAVGFYIEAAKTYRALLDIEPSDESALYELAELYQEMGRRDEMFEIFDQIEKELGIKEEIVREKQRIYMKEGKLDLAISEYQKLVDAFPNESAYRLELISFLIQNKKLSQAEQAIHEYEEVTTSSSRTLLMKSELAWLKNNREESIQLLEKALEVSSIDFEAKFKILSNYILLNTDPDMQPALTKVAMVLARQYPDEFKAQAFVGDMLYQNGQSEEAVDFYLSAASISPANFSIWQNVLNVEAELNRYDSLIVHAEKALEYFPNQALLYYFAGTGYLIKKDYRKAVRTLEMGKKYTTDPNLLTVFYGQLGDAYNGLEEKQKSYAAYDEALNYQPNNDHVLNNYSYFLSLDKYRLEKALEMSTQLVKQHPDNPTYLDTHGWVLYVAGDYEEARKYLEKAATLDEDGTVIEHYGDVLYQLGQVEEAMEQWKKAKETGEASDLIDHKIKDKKLHE